MPFLAHTYGITPHCSPLLRKARLLGFATADQLLELAVERGCRHYAPPGWQPGRTPDPGRERLSDAELAIALMSAAQQGDARHIRCAAQLLGAPGLCPRELARLARMERCVPALRHIAEAAVRHDPGHAGFWQELLAGLPPVPALPQGRLPHYSRFLIQAGWTPRHRPARPAVWLRPR